LPPTAVPGAGGAALVGFLEEPNKLEKKLPVEAGALAGAGVLIYCILYI
jgi:hypothetical protein